jgi:hypothetical protein
MYEDLNTLISMLSNSCLSKDKCILDFKELSKKNLHLYNTLLKTLNYNL